MSSKGNKSEIRNRKQAKQRNLQEILDEPVPKNVVKPKRKFRSPLNFLKPRKSHKSGKTACFQILIGFIPLLYIWYQSQPPEYCDHEDINNRRCTDKYFALDYFEARNKFLNYSKNLGKFPKNVNF